MYNLFIYLQLKQLNVMDNSLLSFYYTWFSSAYLVEYGCQIYTFLLLLKSNSSDNFVVFFFNHVQVISGCILFFHTYPYTITAHFRIQQLTSSYLWYVVSYLFPCIITAHGRVFKGIYHTNALELNPYLFFTLCETQLILNLNWTGWVYLYSIICLSAGAVE